MRKFTGQFIVFDRLYFKAALVGHSRTEQKVQGCHRPHLLSPRMQPPPLSISGTRVGHLLPFKMNLHWQLIITRSSYFTLWFTLADVHSVGFDKCIMACLHHIRTSQVVLVVKNPPAHAGDVGVTGSIPGLGRSSGGGHGKSGQYSCLENPMDRRDWRATVHRVTKLDTTEATWPTPLYYHME